MKQITPLLFLATAFVANAATVAYYQFDDGAAGTNAGTLLSEVNSPARDGTASGVSSNSPSASASLPRFSSVTVGPTIISGIGGGVVNGDNSTSLEFINGTGGIANPGGAIGGKVTVAGTTLLASTTFTMEGFIKVDTFINFATIFSMSRVDGNGSVAWQLDTNSGGNLRFRLDNLGAVNGDGSAAGTNKEFATTGAINDGAWHHVAVTYDGSRISVYMDYLLVGSALKTINYGTGTGSLSIGASGGSSRTFDGLVDEVLYTDSVLATSAFLRAIPEPSTAILGLSSMFLLFIRRRR